ncbi:MAG TPA: aminotransferase class IV [Candidatus Polarisedimenticolia bacterium]|nr:aminotransferase class IV [Candidatus Polarisedimenticolia bacterium]
MASPISPRGSWAGYVWLNGDVLSASEARLSVFDRGILLGDGVYETLRAHHGKVFRWEEHRSRLEGSLRGARIELPFPTSSLQEAIGACLAANQLRDARIRLTVTRGEGDPGFDMMPGSRPNVVIAASEWRSLPERCYEEGIRTILATVRQTGRESLNPALKSISRIHLVLARLEASDQEAQEAILLGSDDRVREGTSSNIFVVKNGRVRTPSIDSGILEGVTRAVVLEVAAEAGIACEEDSILPDELRGADEIFFTNTSWGALPAGWLDARPVGRGGAGPVARELRRRVAQRTAKECEE